MKSETTFAPCPLLSQFALDQTINVQGYFKEELSDYAKGRITFLLRQFYGEGCTGFSTKEVSVESWKNIVSLALNSIRPNIKASSWGRYKSALRTILNHSLEKKLAPDNFIRSILADITCADVSETSENKVRKANRIRVNEIYSMRLAVRTESERLALQWLEFNLLTNLRPNELEHAEIFIGSDGPLLTAKNTIKNAKTKAQLNDGTYSDIRSVPLNNLSFHDFIACEQFIISARQLILVHGYSTFYQQMRVQLRNLSTRCFKRSISLSVGRKQYAANHKRITGDNEELARLMGHSDPTRPQRSYGRKQFGFAQLAVRDENAVYADEQENEK